ncbi:MAG: hypothetical protein AB1714_23375 [Acidobacteriota bacterium]
MLKRLGALVMGMAVVGFAWGGDSESAQIGVTAFVVPALGVHLGYSGTAGIPDVVTSPRLVADRLVMRRGSRAPASNTAALRLDTSSETALQRAQLLPTAAQLSRFDTPRPARLGTSSPPGSLTAASTGNAEEITVTLVRL